MLDGILGFFKSVHERECPVNGGRPYSWVPARRKNNKKKKVSKHENINKRNEYQKVSVKFCLVRVAWLKREHLFALWGFAVRKLQDFPQFAAYKMQKNYQNVSLFISHHHYMHVRTSQMRANWPLLKRRTQSKISHTYRNPYGRSSLFSAVLKMLAVRLDYDSYRSLSFP